MSMDRYEEAYEKIRLARESAASGDTEQALLYIEEALALDPGNPDAWIEKMRAVKGSVADPACREVYTAGQNAIRCAGEDEAEIERLVYALYLVRAQELMGTAGEKLASLKAEEAAAAEKAGEIETGISSESLCEEEPDGSFADEIKALDALASTHALSLILSVPDEKIKAYPELASVVGGCAAEYEKVSDALAACLKDGGFALTDGAKEAREHILGKIKAKMA